MALPGVRPAFSDSKRTKYPRIRRTLTNEMAPVVTYSRVGVENPIDLINAHTMTTMTTTWKIRSRKMARNLDPRPARTNSRETPSGVAATNRSSISTI